MWMTWALLPLLFSPEVIAEESGQTSPVSLSSYSGVGGEEHDGGSGRLKVGDRTSDDSADDETEEEDQTEKNDWVEISAQHEAGNARNRKRTRRIVGISTGAIGAGLLAAGGVFRSRLRDEVAELGGQPETGWPQDIESLQLQTNILIISGWLGLGAGTVMGLMPVQGSPEPTFALSVGWSTRW